MPGPIHHPFRTFSRRELTLRPTTRVVAFNTRSFAFRKFRPTLPVGRTTPKFALLSCRPAHTKEGSARSPVQTLRWPGHLRHFCCRQVALGITSWSPCQAQSPNPGFWKAGAYTPAGSPSGGVYHPGFHIAGNISQRVLTEARAGRSPAANNRSSRSQPLTLWVALLHQLRKGERGEERELFVHPTTPALYLAHRMSERAPYATTCVRGAHPES